MIDLYTYINEASILGDLEDTLSIGDSKVPHIVIQNFLKNNFTGKFKISEKPNKDGKYEVTAGVVGIKNYDITKLTNDLFIWKKVTGDFRIQFCNNLISIEGAPKEVKGDFVCMYCKSLESLEGAPKIVGGDFIAHTCKKEFSKTEIENNSIVKGDIIADIE